MIEMTILKIGSNNCIPVKCISKTAKMTPTEFNRSQQNAIMHFVH